MSGPSSIPGHRRGPTFTCVPFQLLEPLANGSASPLMRFIVAGLILVPTGSYVLLKSRLARIQRDQRRFEEEGRRNWIRAQEEKAAGKS